MRKKIAGAIYGMALGDAMGMPSELWGREKVRKYFGKIEGLLDGPKENSVACNYKKGQFTDDTGQALVIIDSLNDTNFKPNSRDIAIKLLKWAEKENAFENNILGPTSKVALANFRDGINSKAVTDKALSNGSAMRIAPIGCLFNSHNKEKLADFVYSVSEVTHTSDITIAGAAMIAVAVSSAIENNDFDIVIKDIFEMEPIARRLGAETYSPSLTERIKIGIYLANEYKNNEDLFLEKLYDIVGAGVNISESVPSAISIAYYAQDPNKCALLCANLAGDTDTIGAMATAICGAFKGIDYIKEEYIESLNKANDVDFNNYISILMNGRSCL
ncbi:ADP-ribosylglycohydrolase family protein [uncultured Clostridium sp.]|mgnify:FL=1|uniref:ADP-ribosylglycohydrolase family protein n=1 Tax=Clostridium sp. TaxID=1506 RepID=UPI0025DD2D93|nr:ADP-ribosylglycohydrolase family protein [uncultured Clostridium sp.]